MTEQTPPGGGDQGEAPDPTPLLSAFTAAMEAKADRRAPTSVAGAIERYGWTTRDLAREMGVSERTARRYRQQNRIPGMKAERWREVNRNAATARQRERITRRGLRGMNVEGTYRISRSRYRARRDFPVRFVEGRITGAQMREVFGAATPAEAEELLNDALAEAYGAPGLYFEDVEGLDFTI